jgi:hypothetical protein
MTETYSINRRTWKWTKKLFFICLTWPFWIVTFFFPN